MERLQKVIASAGVTSRRKAEALITAGKVKVNGTVVTELGTKVASKDKIEVNGIPIQKEALAYFVMHKPRGCVTTVSDDLGRKTVIDFLGRHINVRLFPVGRLDYDTSGVLLLTNDGDFANQMMHPKGGIAKTYLARVRGLATRATLKPLTRGLIIDGYKTKPATFSIMSQDMANDSSLVELTIHEGRNHQVKKMLEAVGHPVKKLRREKFGNLDVNGISPGDFRPLSLGEVQALKQLAAAEKSEAVVVKKDYRQY